MRRWSGALHEAIIDAMKGSSVEVLYRRPGFRPTGEDSLRKQTVWDGTKI
jgi:hypothetical protein